LRALQTNVAIVCVCLLLAVANVQAARAAETTSDDNIITAGITATDIDNAIVKVKSDPNLARERKIKSLRWHSDDKPVEPTVRPGWLKWIGQFFGFLAQTSRVIVWLVIAVAVALLVVVIAKIIRNIGPRSRVAPFVAPTHVRDLDIRPESLPADIGAAALAMWERGEHRAALALLYRGLLSRLVHVHEIPIRHSSTEGDCVALSLKYLQGAPSEYVARVVRVWQRAVYGAQTPQTQEVEFICAGFAVALSKQIATSPAP